MTAKEAYKIFTSIYDKLLPNSKIVKCMDYKSRFVFYVDIGDTGVKHNNVMFAVHKANGKVMPFKPFHIPVEEYRSGKLVTLYK